MPLNAAVEGRIHASIDEVAPAAWDRLFPRTLDRWRIRRAMEKSPPAGIRAFAAAAYREGEVVAAVPLFAAHYRLDTSLTGPTHRIVSAIHRLMPGLVRIPLLGLGSPLSDRVGLGFAPVSTTAERREAFRAILDAVAGYARKSGAHLIAVKDASAEDTDVVDDILRVARYAAVPSQPEAVLDLPFRSLDDYMAHLSPSMRADLRRKQRHSAGKVRFERIASVGEMGAALHGLYEATRARSGIDFDGFDDIHPGYIGAFLDAAGEHGCLTLGWVGDQLASFNLGLVEEDRFVAHKIGLAYPLARDHDLYFLNWLDVVGLCIARGIARAEMGQTTYALKQRLGCRLEPSRTYFRHRLAPINALMRRLAPMAGFDDLEQRAGPDRHPAHR